jgi:hypothetical protein
MKFLLTVILLIALKCYSQNRQADTSFFYSILLVEKATVVKDMENSILIGDYFDKMYIVNDADTINIKYNYPFMITEKETLFKLKNLSTHKNNMNLYMLSARGKRKILIKMPFNVAFDHYIVILSHRKLGSILYDCYFSSVIYGYNTSNKGYGIATDIYNQSR